MFIVLPPPSPFLCRREPSSHLRLRRGRGRGAGRGKRGRGRRRGGGGEKAEKVAAAAGSVSKEEEGLEGEEKTAPIGIGFKLFTTGVDASG
jgi:hypothetical protein